MTDTSSERTTVKQPFMVHEGGTKFYEVTTFSSSPGRTLAARRYGRISSTERGGQMEVDVGPERGHAIAVAAKIKRGYVVQSERTATMDVRSQQIVSGEIVNIETHLINQSFRTAYASVFGSSQIDTWDAPVAPAAPEPAIDRGDNWASW